MMFEITEKQSYATQTAHGVFVRVLKQFIDIK